MTKQEFMDALSGRLDSLPDSERTKSLEYYDEMIGDRMEDGMSEEEAVAALGGMDDIVSSVMNSQSLSTLLQAKINGGKQKMSSSGLWIVLLVLSSPLLIAVASVILALFISVWAIILSLYAVLIALGVACAGCLVGGSAIMLSKSLYVGLCAIGCSLVCGALTMLAIKFVPWLTKKLLALTAAVIRGVKAMLIGRKAA